MMNRMAVLFFTIATILSMMMTMRMTMTRIATMILTTTLLASLQGLGINESKGSLLGGALEGLKAN